MLLLLPPSEGKSSARRRGRPLDLDSLAFPELTTARREVLDALVSLSRGPRDIALAALGLPPGLSTEVDKDAVLESATAVPVERLYTGVLYDSLALETLDGAARRRARAWIVVSSALFGAVRLTDRIPPYRLSMAARLPGIAPLPTLWRPALDRALPHAAGRGLVVDLRSSSYAAAWRIPPDLAARTAVVRVLHESTPGDSTSRSVVSHFNKATKGRLVRALLESGTSPTTVPAFRKTLAGLGYTVEATPPENRQRAWTLDVVVASL